MTQVPKLDSRRDLISLANLRGWIRSKFEKRKRKAASGSTRDPLSEVANTSFSRRAMLQGTASAATVVSTPGFIAPDVQTIESALLALSHSVSDEFMLRMFKVVWEPLTACLFGRSKTDNVAQLIEQVFKIDPEAALEGVNVIVKVLPMDLGVSGTPAGNYRQQKVLKKLFQAFDSNELPAEIREKLMSKQNVRDLVKWLDTKFSSSRRTKNDGSDKQEQRKILNLEIVFRRDVLMMIQYYENKLFSGKIDNKAAKVVIQELEKRHRWLEELEGLDQA